MNKLVISGRLTREPEIRYSAGESQTAIARFTLAVNRKFKRQGEPDADFINCVAFGNKADWCEQYLHQGTKIEVSGRIQTGSYTNKENQKVYTTDCVVEECEFAESKTQDESRRQGANVDEGQSAPAPKNTTRKPAAKSAKRNTGKAPAQSRPSQSSGGFVNIPEGMQDEIPFN